MSVGAVVVDTGVVLAAADADDAWHEAASAVVEDRPADQLVLPVPVAVEAAWLIGSRLGPATEPPSWLPWAPVTSPSSS